jgi:hypothetical protein
MVYKWRESPSLAKKRILTPKKEPCFQIYYEYIQIYSYIFKYTMNTLKYIIDASNYTINILYIYLRNIEIDNMDI